MVGSLLNVKPLLTVTDGEVTPLARVRSMRQGMDRIVAELRERMPLRGLAVLNAGVPEMANELRERVCAAYSDLDVSSGRIGPVVGAYTGPGGLGVASLGAD